MTFCTGLGKSLERSQARAVLSQLSDAALKLCFNRLVYAYAANACSVITALAFIMHAFTVLRTQHYMRSEALPCTYSTYLSQQAWSLSAVAIRHSYIRRSFSKCHAGID